jgi:hypothetical protein
MKLELPLKTIPPPLPRVELLQTFTWQATVQCAQLIRPSKNGKPHPHTIF